MKTAVVLFNLGGPDSLDAVRPFLFNLFNDKAIIAVPQPLRWWLARKISGKRAPVARDIYARLGGRSPLLEQTQAQAQALQTALGSDFKVVIAMRYWHPFANQAVEEVRRWGADKVVLLPLYPQFSTTTTGSSVRQWRHLAGQEWPDTRLVCCYPDHPGLIKSMADTILAEWPQAAAIGRPRLLLSAHGLPEQLVLKGDPYQAQVEQTAAALARATGLDDLDWALCYQSRVGPAKWIGPGIDEELTRAASDGVPVVVAPIAFVSEHSETLVELDIEYRHLAEKLGVPGYFRAAAIGTHPAFITALAELVTASSTGRACGRAKLNCPGRDLR